MLSEEKISALNAGLRGSVVQPFDADYDRVRKIYNAMFDKRPALIARCVDVADVIASVNFARENNLLLAVKGGGHNAAGLGMCDGGLVIDLSPMKGIRIDPNDRTARVEGGCTLADIDHATHAVNRMVPSGIIGTTGIGGITLGGGLGYFTRQCGLTIDNLLEADVVLADGRYVKASATMNEDLFWALRGGGGNFGVVTSFLFQTQPYSTVYAGPMLWELSEAKERMQWFRNFITEAPDNINGFFAFLTVPPAPPFPDQLHLKKMCGIVWCYTGPLDKAEEVFRPIREMKTPALDFVGPIPVPALNGMFDGLYPPGLQWYWKADFFDSLPDEAIDRHIEHARQLPTMHSSMHLYAVNGAAGRVANEATAWSNRNTTFAEVIIGVDPDPANREKITNWAKDYWEALHPFSTGGAYLNFIMEEGEDRIKKTYGKSYERLVQIKNKYDPENLFRVNQNIKPTVQTTAPAERVSL